MLDRSDFEEQYLKRNNNCQEALLWDKELQCYAHPMVQACYEFYIEGLKASVGRTPPEPEAWIYYGDTGPVIDLERHKVESLRDFYFADKEGLIWPLYRAVRPEPLRTATEERVVTPVPMLLHCPQCQQRHIDEGPFEDKAHHTHACQICGHVWRPALVATVGVRFLPGFKN